MAKLDKIVNDLYRIQVYLESTGISFNQYVIKDEKSILIHTGSAPLFEEITEKLWQVVIPTDLVYVFISHFEADECGALAKLLAVNPNIVPVGSAVTARQLTGFGLHLKPLAMKEGDELALGKRKLRFITYPSEAHLGEGLIAYEEKGKVLFSSDLFISRGKEETTVKKASAPEALTIAPRSIPDPEARQKCQEAINKLAITLVAPGHGQVLDLRA